MARNIEIKARVRDMSLLTRAANDVADEGPARIRQDDTFFRCADGRLKLRDFGDGSGELIFYRRADEAGPRTSFYVRTPTADPAGLREALALAIGVAGRVRKERVLFLAGRTRIHLDRVEELGDFMELEVVLRDDEPAEQGIAEARTLMRRLGIEDDQLVDRAYVDLLAGRAATPRGS